MSDHGFVGSIPEVYDRCMGPMLFLPYAVELAARLAPVAGDRVLELAAGTGIATAEVVRALPSTAQIVVTDLNEPMLAVAGRRVVAPNVRFQAVDAQDLPFGDASFDTVYCQFGVMFLPDKATAYREMRRVIPDGGTLIFSVWDRIEASPLTAVVDAAVARFFPDDPPGFMSRVPHGYHDPDAIRAALTAAGFGRVEVEAVTLPCEAASAREVAIGFCQGTPIRHEITTRSGSLPEVTDAVTEAVADRFGDGRVRTDMKAFVVTAR